MKREIAGYLVAVEGIDGAGKTTVARRLALQIQAWGYSPVVVTRFHLPALTRLWKQLLDRDALDQTQAALLAACDYFAGLEQKIEPALARGSVVVADRYFYSHIVYGGVRGVSRARLGNWYSEARIPDLIIHLRLTPQAALGRLRAKGKPDFWEAGLDRALGRSPGQACARYRKRQPQQKEIDQAFLRHQTAASRRYGRLLPPDRTVALDATLPEPTLAAQAAWAVRRKLLVNATPARRRTSQFISTSV